MSATHGIKTVLVTGGAGYVGAVTVPKLLKAGYRVKVLDLYYYGDHVLKEVHGHPGLEEVRGDIRDESLLKKVLPGCDAVLHLACISNDPSFELDPGLGKSINHDAFRPLVEISKEAGVSRFIYVSSSSVFGVKEEEQVTEDLPLEPLTDYSKFKALCEQELMEYADEEFSCLVIRPATVCGYSPRLRLDLTVNILTNHAFNKNRILVFGGRQQRPNIHIEDISDLYVQCLKWEHSQINRKIYNVGYENHSVAEIAEMVRSTVGDRTGRSIEVKVEPTNDERSYRISSQKIARELGFAPRHTIAEAVADLCDAFNGGKIPESFTNTRYFNIKRMQEVLNS